MRQRKLEACSHGLCKFTFTPAGIRHLKYKTARFAMSVHTQTHAQALRGSTSHCVGKYTYASALRQKQTRRAFPMQLNRGHASGLVARSVSGRRTPAMATQLLRSASPTVDPVGTIEVATPSGASATLSAPSGEILRRTLIDNKQELYQGMWAKAMNCGGSGSCGTCVVEVGGRPCSNDTSPPHAARFPESQGPERPDTDPYAVAAAPTTDVTGSS